MNSKSRGLLFLSGVLGLYLGGKFIHYIWIGVPLMVGGVLLIVNYIRQMRKKEE